MMTEVHNIEAHMQPMILELYRSFLRESTDAEELEYSIYGDEITANFVHKYYMSTAGLGFCCFLDIEPLRAEPGFEVMQELLEALAALYPAEEDEEAA